MLTGGGLPVVLLAAIALPWSGGIGVVEHPEKLVMTNVINPIVSQFILGFGDATT